MMAWWRDNPLLRRALFVSGNLMLCFLIFSSVVMPTRAFFADRDSRIVDQRKLLSRLTAIAGQEAVVRSVEANTGAQMHGVEFLAGPNDNVINADLQTRLQAIAAAAGAQSRAVQSLPPKTSDQIRYSGSRIEIYGPLQSIHRAIYAVESAKPYLFIAGAVLRMAPASDKLGVPEEPVIQAQLDIFGAMQVEGRDP